MAPEERDPRSAMTLVIGAVGVVLLAVLVILLQALFYRTAEAERWRKVVSQPPQELRQLQAGQLDRINSYRWIDEPNGVVAVPIDRAMELVLEEARSGAPRTAER